MNIFFDSCLFEGVILVCIGFEESREIDLLVCVEMVCFIIFVMCGFDLCLFWFVILCDVL